MQLAMQICNTLILLLCLVGRNSTAFSDQESNDAELNIAMKFIERLLKQHESPDGSNFPSLPPPPDYVVDQQEEVPDYFEFGDQHESSNEDQDESSPKEKEAEFETDCIDLIRVVAQTSHGKSASQSPDRGANPQLVLQTEKGYHYSELPGRKESGKETVFELSTSQFSPTLPKCLVKQEIKSVSLQARVHGNDGWHVASIATYVKSTSKPYTQITSDQTLNRWVDYDQDGDRLVHLSSVETTAQAYERCLTKLRIAARTGSHHNAGFSPSQANHKIGLKLKNGQIPKATLTKGGFPNQEYALELDLNAFSPSVQCIRRSDITAVSLFYGGPAYYTPETTWLIAGFATYVTDVTNIEQKLTDDPDFYGWLYNANESPTFYPVPLLIDTPKCGYGIPVCTCSATAQHCVINLEIDEIRTFTSYRKFPVEDGEGIFVRGTQGVVYEIDDNGELQYLEPYTERDCAKNFDRTKCSDPQFVDGKTYRMAIAVNAQIPGPTIIVHEGQTITIHVHNNMSSEGISIHWHGMHQMDTPWMDGVGQITQCQIGPSSSFSYTYKASPSGTFWYHSHSGAQRTDGFYGALIVQEKTKKVLPNIAYEDRPDKHTISLLDWQHEISLDLFSQLNAGLGFYPGVPIGEVPPNMAGIRYESTRSFEEGEVGPVPYYSGLINGKGRHSDVPYVKTRLSTFPVVKGESYRFRLIGAQGLYAYKFSIDGHKLKVVSTDGYWTNPTEPADYIIIHTGERYDFILTADAEVKNYWIRAETLEIDRSSNDGAPPFKSLGHVAEGILQYTSDIDNPPEIPSTDYRCIKANSPLRKCLPSDRCLAINCPFQNFHAAYYTDCFNVNQLTLLDPTPSDKLPSPEPESSCDDCLHFFNFNFEGDSETSSVNGRNFILPPAPPQTQFSDFQQQSKICDLNADCNPSTLSCLCTHMVTISKHMATIQFVLTALGDYQNAHPIHLHGHTFHVVDIGYPEYNSTTGFISSHSKAIECGDVNYCNGKGEECNPKRCTKPQWNPMYKPTLGINSRTIRKDTVIVPAGGYVVINFISDNPGFWFLHCHIEVHQLEGMSVVINEVQSEQQSAPEGLNKCGDYELTVSEYFRAINDGKFAAAY